MGAKMSVATRKELLKHIQQRYKEARYSDKSKILDEFCTLTSYGLKYPINLFNSTGNDPDANKLLKRHNNRKYDEALRQALLTIWNAANQICSKRLVPFIPDLLSALERFGHVSLPEDVRSKLLTISPGWFEIPIPSTQISARIYSHKFNFDSLPGKAAKTCKGVSMRYQRKSPFFLLGILFFSSAYAAGAVTQENTGTPKLPIIKAGVYNIKTIIEPNNRYPNGAEEKGIWIVVDDCCAQEQDIAINRVRTSIDEKKIMHAEKFDATGKYFIDTNGKLIFQISNTLGGHSESTVTGNQDKWTLRGQCTSDSLGGKIIDRKVEMTKNNNGGYTQVLYAYIPATKQWSKYETEIVTPKT
jgi:hypothetical protein